MIRNPAFELERTNCPRTRALQPSIYGPPVARASFEPNLLYGHEASFLNTFSSSIHAPFTNAALPFGK